MNLCGPSGTPGRSHSPPQSPAASHQRAAGAPERRRTCLRPRGSVPTVLAKCWILLLSMGRAGSPPAALAGLAPKPTKLALWFC